MQHGCSLQKGPSGLINRLLIAGRPCLISEYAIQGTKIRQEPNALQLHPVQVSLVTSLDMRVGLRQVACA